jgi:hypothetical protein
MSALAFLSVLLATTFALVFALRLCVVLIDSGPLTRRRLAPDGIAARLRALVSRPARQVAAVVIQGGFASALLHPLGLTLALIGALAASAFALVPDLLPWSGQAIWLLATSLAGFAASVAVVWAYPASPRGMRTVRRSRRRIAHHLVTRLRSAAPSYRDHLARQRDTILHRFDLEFAPAFAQLLRRDLGTRLEIEEYENSSAAPNPEVLGRLRLIYDGTIRGTRAAAQAAIDAEARLFAVLQETDDARVVDGLRRWIDELDLVMGELGVALAVPSTGVTTPEPIAAATAPDIAMAAVEPPPNFVDVTRRAIRAMNSPRTLMTSELTTLLPSSLDAIWRRTDVRRLARPSPIELGQALRTLLVEAIERLNVLPNAELQAHQYQVLRMQYLMGLTVVQVAMRLSISEKSVFRRSAEGVEAVASEIWRREQIAASTEAMPRETSGRRATTAG